MRTTQLSRQTSTVMIALAFATLGCGADTNDESVTTDDPPPTTSARPTTSPPATAATTSHDSTTPTTTPTTTPVTSPTDSMQEITTVPTPPTPPAGNVAIAIADLAERLDIDSADIEVVDVEEVTWPDGSIGCPEPGLNYTQALVDGQLIVLGAGDRTFEYHAADGRPPFYCPPDRLRPPIVDPRI